MEYTILTWMGFALWFYAGVRVGTTYSLKKKINEKENLLR